MGEKKGMKKPPPLPVSMAADIVVTKKKAIRSAPPFPAVQMVCVWALISAFVVAAVVIHDAAHYGDPVTAAPPPPASRWATRIPLTEAGTLAAAGIEAWQLWLSAPQAAAASAALLLSDPRRRRALAFVALAAAAANHCLCARLIGGVLFVAAPGNYHLIIDTVALAVIGVFDMLAFMALLSSSGEEE